MNHHLLPNVRERIADAVVEEHQIESANEPIVRLLDPDEDDRDFDGQCLPGDAWEAHARLTHALALARKPLGKTFCGNAPSHARATRQRGRLLLVVLAARNMLGGRL